MVLKLESVSYSYSTKSRAVIKNMNYEFNEGKVYAVMGKSGAGKTTLLSLLSSLAKPTNGKIIYKDIDINQIDQYKYRSEYIGVIFQSFNLLPNLTAIENVMLSMDISNKKIDDKQTQALNLLKSVGLDQDTAKRRILKLSGGEQQRVAIARTLAYNPSVILADEPTGNLDGETEDSILNIFENLAHKENKCVIIVTHSKEVGQRADEIYALQKS